MHTPRPPEQEEYAVQLESIVSLAQLAEAEGQKGPQRTELRAAVDRWNAPEGPCLRCGKYAPFRHVVTVRAHKRASYLRLALQAVAGPAAGGAYLVVSHDGAWADTVEAARDSVGEEVPLKQLFFPHSRYIVGIDFPGDVPGDCPSRPPRPPKCGGTPDTYGHYREANVVAIKHHYWWLQNYVFGTLFPAFDGMVLALEEDHVVSPDWLPALDNLARLCSTTSCCGFVSLDDGSGVRPSITPLPPDTAVAKTAWSTYVVNMGAAFTRSFWRKVHERTEIFCAGFDEYNWDFTLGAVLAVLPPFCYLQPERKRIQHIGTCGHHATRKDCSPSLAPWPPGSSEPGQRWQLRGLARAGTVGRRGAGNGGWRDPRDIALCRETAQLFHPRTAPPQVRGSEV